MPAVALLLLVKLLFEFSVFVNGFRSMGPDDFAKILISQDWAHAPFFASPNYVWLPLEFWILGTSLRIWENPYFVSLLVNSLFSVLAVTIFYKLTKLLFGSTIALISMSIAIFLPWVVWLSISCPGDSMSHFLGFLGLFWLFKWRRSGKDKHLFLSSLSFLVFTMARQYGWFFSFIFSLHLLWQVFLNRSEGNNRVRLFLAAVIPWLFPILWFTLNYIHYGDVFHFLGWFHKYVAQTGGEPLILQPLVVRVFQYPFYIFITSPLISVLSLVALSQIVRRKDGNRSLYLLFIVGYLCLLIAWSVQSGRATGFYPQRYVLIPVMLLIPFVSHLIYMLASSKRMLVAIALCATIIGWNVISSFHYPKWDRTLDCLGVYLSHLWQKGQLDAEDKVLLAEDSPYDALPIRVFSRHGTNILHDRPYYRSEVSVFSRPIDEMIQFLQENNVRIIILQDPDLVTRIPADFRFLTCIGGYKLFCPEEIEDALAQELRRVPKPDVNRDVRAAFDDKIELLGCFSPRDEFHRYIILQWRLLAGSMVDYEVSVRFVSVDDPATQFSATFLPVSGVFQNTQAEADRLGEDRVHYRLPPQYPSGEYILEVGIISSDSTPLPVLSSTNTDAKGKNEVSVDQSYVVLPSKTAFIAQFVKGENRNFRLLLRVLVSLLS
jgi:hypothetical protein